MVKINFSVATIRKIVICAFSLLAISILAATKSEAYTLSPSSGTLNNGGVATISVLAQPTGTTNSAYVHIIVPSGMTVTGFTSATSGPNIGGCTGSVNFLPNEICAALGHSTNLTAGQLLGTFTLTSTTNGSYSLTAGGDAEYGNGQVVSGTLATYTVATSGQTLPVTSFFSDEKRFLSFGVLLVVLGLTISQLYKLNLSINLNKAVKEINTNRKRKLREDSQENFEEKVLRS